MCSTDDGYRHGTCHAMQVFLKSKDSKKGQEDNNANGNQQLPNDCTQFRIGNWRMQTMVGKQYPMVSLG
jgi:hypothetical protein